MEGKLKYDYTIAIVCSSLHSYGSDFLEKYSENEIYNCICIYNKRIKSRSKIKILKKIFRIGIFGAFIGIWLRKFYRSSHKNIEELCKKRMIPFYVVEDFNVKNDDKEKFRMIDLAVSMGNGYIPSSFYSLFKNGMINIHHELLPDYAGASSVIWSLYDKKRTTGFTIHKINHKIDCGEILYKQEMSIIFKKTLGETISETYISLKNESIDKLHHVLSRLKHFQGNTFENIVNKTYTTPSLKQFLVILKNFNELRSE